MSARIYFSWLKPTKKWNTVVKLGQIRNTSGKHHSCKNLQMTSDRFDADPKKVDVIREGRTPTNIPEVGRFLGFSNSYRPPVENQRGISKAIVRMIEEVVCLDPLTTAQSRIVRVKLRRGTGTHSPPSFKCSCYSYRCQRCTYQHNFITRRRSCDGAEVSYVYQQSFLP